MMFGGNAFSINGKTMDINRIDEVVKAGSTEIWHLENTSMMAHPLHIHDKHRIYLKFDKHASYLNLNHDKLPHHPSVFMF
jgi:FtsP/CotA-like multicopper oxidase with cupredoxin domain